jgi:hypothetical protein
MKNKNYAKGKRGILRRLLPSWFNEQSDLSNFFLFIPIFVRYLIPDIRTCLSIHWTNKTKYCWMRPEITVHTWHSEGNQENFHRHYPWHHSITKLISTVASLQASVVWKKFNYQNFTVCQVSCYFQPNAFPINGVTSCTTTMQIRFIKIVPSSMEDIYGMMIITSIMKRVAIFSILIEVNTFFKDQKFYQFVHLTISTFHIKEQKLLTKN